MSQFFISYKREEKPFALLVKGKIEENGHLGWLDENIQGGKKWKVVIDNAIKASLGVIVVVSPASMNSQYVTYEWAFALGLGKPVIPVIYESPAPHQMHPQLQELHQWNFSNSRRRQWKNLLKNLHEIDQEQFVPPMVERALETLLYQYDSSVWPSAIKTLERYPHKQAVEALAQAVGHDLDEISIQCALALARKTDHKDPRAIQGLNRVFYVANLENLLHSSIDALGRIGGDNAAMCLIDAYNKLKDAPTTNEFIVRTIEGLNNPLAIELFRNILRTRSGGTINLTNIGIAALGLGRLKDYSALPELLELLKDRSFGANPKRNVIQAIGELNDPVAVPDLINTLDLFPQTIREDVAEPIIKTLMKIETTEAKDYLSKRRAQHEWIRRVIDGNSSIS